MNYNHYYYYTGDAEEIETILRDGFIDYTKRTDTGQLGVYVADSPGAPCNPNEGTLEITLPTQINSLKWRLVIPEKPALWNEWIIPARVLNKHARVRPLSSEEWEQAWTKFKLERREEVIKAREELTAAGFIEHAKDSQGYLMYRNGKPVWQVSKKGRSINPEDSAEFKAALKAARLFPPQSPGASN